MSALLLVFIAFGERECVWRGRVEAEERNRGDEGKEEEKKTKKSIK